MGNMCCSALNPNASDKPPVSQFYLLLFLLYVLNIYYCVIVLSIFVSGVHFLLCGRDILTGLDGITRFDTAFFLNTFPKQAHCVPPEPKPKGTTGGKENFKPKPEQHHVQANPKAAPEVQKKESLAEKL